MLGQECVLLFILNILCWILRWRNQKANERLITIRAFQMVIGGCGDSQVLTTKFDEDYFTSIF